MLRDRRLVGRRVRVTYRPGWPVRYGRYTYEGWTDDGLWLRRPDGFQRLVLDVDIQKIEEVKDDQDES